MYDIPVDAHLEVLQAPQGLKLTAFASAPPRLALRWKLSLVSNSRGGSNTVTQGGQTLADPDTPVGTVTIRRDSDGSATLVILDGDTEVASETLTFEAGKVVAKFDN